MNSLMNVERQVKALMTTHGVGHVPFRFSKAYRSIASVKYVGTRSVTGVVYLPEWLSLSKRWAMVLPEHDLWEVIIHEIGHIHAGPFAHHNHEFKAAVRAMGGKATRACYTPSVNIDGSPRS